MSIMLKDLIKPANLRLKSSRFKNADEGATAVEFAFVAVPFFIMIFTLVGFALYFLMSNSIDKGMDTTSRLLRTGQAQKANMTVNDFKQAICNSGGAWITCNKVQVFVQKFTKWDDNPATVPQCQRCRRHKLGVGQRSNRTILRNRQRNRLGHDLL